MNLSRFRYLSLAGAAVRGVRYIGFYQALCDHEEGVSFLDGLKGACGTSSGAFFALCILARVPPSELSDFVRGELSSFAPEFDVNLLLRNYGVNDGAVLCDFLAASMALMGLSPTTTFRDFERLTRLQFACCATNLTTRRPVYFSAATSPDTPLIDALRMSMGAPFMFTPVLHDGELYSDGMLMDNMPSHLFPEAETVFSEVRTRPPAVHSLSAYIETLMSCGVGAQCRPGANVIALPDTVESDPFQLTEEQFVASVDDGYASTTCHLRPEVGACVTIILRILQKNMLIENG